jgi:hypothetical protein
MEDIFDRNNTSHMSFLAKKLREVNILPEKVELATAVKMRFHGHSMSKLDDIIQLVAADQSPEASAPPPPPPPPVVKAVPPKGMQIHRGKRARGYLVAIYGMPGIGKTTWANKADRAITVDIDKGCAHIDCASVDCNSWQSMLNTTSWFKSQAEFNTLVIDTLDKLEPHLWQHVCQTQKPAWKSIETPGYGRGYVEAAEIWIKFIDDIKAIADSGKNIIFTSHHSIKNIANPEGESYDRYQLALHHKAADQFFNAMDAVLFAQYEQYVSKNQSGDFVATTTQERVVVCGESIAAQCKNRFGMPSKLPFNEELFKWFVLK